MEIKTNISQNLNLQTKKENNLNRHYDLTEEDKEINFKFEFNNEDWSFSKEKMPVKILPAKKVLVFQKENKNIMVSK